MSDPRTRSPKQRSEDRDRVRRLARLLVKVAPLAELLNSPETSDEDRALLRELVGLQRFAEVSINLHQMRSWRSWEIAHAESEAARQVLKRPGLASASFDGDRIMFYRHDETDRGNQS